MEILAAVLAIGGLAFIFGAVLSYASKIFAVKIDERVEKISEILPGANCGGCGAPGCSAYAELVVKGTLPIDACAPGGSAVASLIAGILGQGPVEVIEKRAVVKCSGSHENAVLKYEYYGIESCKSAVLIDEGPKACKYACVGFGDCVSSCPFDAMYMMDNALPFVIEEKCTACGNCVDACPRNIMDILPKSEVIFVGCMSQGRAKEVKSACKVGCTGCSLCAQEKITPGEAITMNGNLPELHYDKDHEFENAVAKCPSKIFVDLRKEDHGVKGRLPGVKEAKEEIVEEKVQENE
ncbi:RnfABCDGE type electron transport complex subunit B [candidate division KSB1 bacterium]